MDSTPNDEIAALLELANRLDAHPEPQALRGKVLSLLFLSPSLRTLASFQAAMTRLGGGSFVISPDMSIHGLEVRDGIASTRPIAGCCLMSTISMSTASTTDMMPNNT